LELLLPDALLPSQLRSELPLPPSPLLWHAMVMPSAGSERPKHGATRSSSRSSSGFRCLIGVTSSSVSDES